jgi:multidrug efflux pump subunit AcrA (membrane-fusion protein)
MRPPSRGGSDLDFVDNALDRSSGTRSTRAPPVPNPDLFLAPGQFARLRVAVAQPRLFSCCSDAVLLTSPSTRHDRF